MAELRAMATRPEYFYWAPDGEQLVAIYRTIAIELPCPGAHFWGAGPAARNEPADAQPATA